MTQYRIATIINYCTNDYRFLDRAIQEVKRFSNQIIIPVCTHFFNGESEDRRLLNRSYLEHPDCLFVEFAYHPKKSYGFYRTLTPEDLNWIHYWHSTSRYVGFYHLEQEIDYVLFLDVDEICDGERFIKWLEMSDLDAFNGVRFNSFFYLCYPSFQADIYTENALLAKKESVDPELLLDIAERFGFFRTILDPKKQYVVGLDGDPLFHHYSWVRTKEETLKKVSSWGHHLDRNWKRLIEKGFSLPSGKRERLFGYKCKQVEPFFDPLSFDPDEEKNPFSLTKKEYPHVKYVDRKTMKKRSVYRQFLKS